MYDELENRVQNQPAFESAERAKVFNDPMLDSLRSNFSNSIQELYNYDKEAAARYANPEGELYIENPATREELVSGGFRNKTAQYAGNWEAYQKRKDILGDVLEKLVKVYELENEGKKIDISKVKDEMATALDLYKAVSDKEYKDKSLAISKEGSTQNERKRNRVMDMLAEDARKGVPLEQIIETYANTLDLPDIIDNYNQNSTWGPAKQNNSQIAIMYKNAVEGSSVNDYLSTMSPDNKKRVSQAVGTLLDNQDLVTAIKKDLGDKAPEFFTSIANANYGKARKLLQPFRNKGSVGAFLEASQAGTRQQIYGSAFTATEAEYAKLWLSGATDQPNQIFVKLAGQSDWARNQVIASFISSGLSREQAEAYLNNMVGYDSNVYSVNNSSVYSVNNSSEETLTGKKR